MECKRRKIKRAPIKRKTVKNIELIKTRNLLCSQKGFEKNGIFMFLS